MTSSKGRIPSDRANTRLGARIGPRVALLTSQGISDHLRRSAHTRAKIHAEGLNEFFRGVGTEKRTHYTPLLDKFLKTDAVPPELAKALRFAAHGRGEASELLTLGTLSSAIGTALGSGIADMLAIPNQRIMQEYPDQVLPPPTLADMAARRIVTEDHAKHDALFSGLNGERTHQLISAAFTFPGLPEALELWRRGLIDIDKVNYAMERAGMHPDYMPGLLALKREELAPADLALMALRGIISEDEGAQVAAKSGIDAEDFDRLIKATGEPPGLMQLLEAYRRGFIDTPRLERGVRQSRVRNEWMDVVEKLRFEPADTSDALRGVIQGHLGEEEGKQIAAWNGLRPEDWDWLVATEGNPPGLMQMAQLWNRGVVDENEFDQAARESHLKNKYIPALRHLRHRLPQERLIMQLVGHKAMSTDEALTLLERLGYEPPVAQAIVRGGLASQTTRDKQLAKSDILELYHDHAITAAKAREHLATLGFHDENADLLLAITDLKREHALQQAAIDGVRSAYVARHIAENEASAALDKIGVPATQRDYMLALWAIQRSTHHKALTEAQLVKANTMGLLSDHDTEQRLLDQGYTLGDARLLLDSEKGRTRNAP